MTLGVHAVQIRSDCSSDFLFGAQIRVRPGRKVPAQFSRVSLTDFGINEIALDQFRKMFDRSGAAVAGTGRDEEQGDKNANGESAAAPAHEFRMHPALYKTNSSVVANWVNRCDRYPLASVQDLHEPTKPHRPQREHMNMKPKNTICLWFDKDAVEAARFYAATFPDSEVTAVHEAPADYPSGKKGDVLTVEFTVFGIPCLGLNGGPEFKHSEAFSFQIATDDQEETDRYWNAIVNNGGQESQCGWCKDRWGLSWQITPRVLTDALAAGGDEAKRAFEAMLPMKKIDVATIEAARRGETVAHV